jgi:hypothetical protein
LNVKYDKQITQNPVAAHYYNALSEDVFHECKVFGYYCVYLISQHTLRPIFVIVSAFQ